MRDKVAAALKRVCYAILSAAVILREAWLYCNQALKNACSHTLASSPFIQSVLQRFSGSNRSRSSTRHHHHRHRGSPPKPPSVLGVVVVQAAFGPADDQALSRLLAWAQVKGFQLVLLFDPGGLIQQRHDALLQSTQWMGDTDQRVILWSGWQPPEEEFSMSFDDDDNSSTVGNKGKQGQHVMGVALLSAADAEEPFRKSIAMHVETSSVKKTANFSTANRGEIGECSIDAAIAAPADIKARLSAASGPIAGIEPDFVVVFGAAFTLAGFPPWAVRSSELFEVGQLAAVTSGKLDAVMKRFLRTRQRFGK